MTAWEFFADGLLSMLRDPLLHLAARLAICLVFLWSGAAKVSKPSVAAEAIRGFKVSRSTIPALGLALGIWELVIAVFVFFELTARFGTILAVLTLLTFSALTIRAIAQRESFACACFGGQESVGPRTLVRSLVLIATCALAAYGMLPSGVETPSLLSAAVVAVAVIATYSLVLVSIDIGRARRRLVDKTDWNYVLYNENEHKINQLDASI